MQSRFEVPQRQLRMRVANAEVIVYIFLSGEPK